MPFLDANARPLDPRALDALGKRQAAERRRREEAAILVAQQLGELDAAGNPVNPDEFETDPDWRPEEVPPARVHEGNGNTPSAASPVTTEELLTILKRTLDVWADDTDSDTSHEEFLRVVRDILATPGKYRLARP